VPPSRAHNRIRARAVGASAAAIATGVRPDPEHCGQDGQFAGVVHCIISLFEHVHRGSLTEAQNQMLLLTSAVTNASVWAVALHAALALK
jgi:hypothetical protein